MLAPSRHALLPPPLTAAPPPPRPPPQQPQEVYGRLEEPDGLQGLVRLRQGGPRPEDQRLAAEKAGNWSEALTLYEQALQHSGVVGDAAANGRAGMQAAAGVLAGGGAPGGGAAAAGAAGAGAGLGGMQRGYLDCLLHIGHLQGLLTQVGAGWRLGGAGLSHGVELGLLSSGAAGSPGQ